MSKFETLDKAQRLIIVDEFVPDLSCPHQYLLHSRAYGSYPVVATPYKNLREFTHDCLDMELTVLWGGELIGHSGDRLQALGDYLYAAKTFPGVGQGMGVDDYQPAEGTYRQQVKELTAQLETWGYPTHDLSNDVCLLGSWRFEGTGCYGALKQLWGSSLVNGRATGYDVLALAERKGWTIRSLTARVPGLRRVARARVIQHKLGAPISDEEALAAHYIAESNPMYRNPHPQEDCNHDDS